MKAAIYLRCSTEDQNTDLQRIDLVAHCDKHNIDYEIFEDYYTGKRMDRPQLQALLSRSKEFHTVFIWQTDRLSRRALDSMLLVKQLVESKIKVVSLRDPFELRTAAGKLQFNVKMAVNQHEVDMIGERTSAGIAAYRAKGNTWGPKPTPLNIDDIKQQLAQGRSATEIAREQGLSRSQLYRRLSA